MTISEFKTMEKRARALRGQIERLTSEAYRITPTLSGMPGSAGSSDKIGAAVAAITDLKDKLSELEREMSTQLSKLHCDIDEENCIYMFLACRYSWRKIAWITTGRSDTADSIRKRCNRYEW